MITINEYFDGAVKSMGYQSAQGKSTIGIIEPGEYEFGTSQHETMQIIEGDLNVLLPGTENWQLFGNGAVFEVPANTSFKVNAIQQVSYLCKYR